MLKAPKRTQPKGEKVHQDSPDPAPAPTVAYPRVARHHEGARRVVHIGAQPFGAQAFVVIAGPCAVESPEMIAQAAREVSTRGAGVLRGGAFKPRTSPYSFQGLGLEGVHMLATASREAAIPFVTEVLSPELVEPMAPLVDAFQIGARNMHNFPLLQAVGRSGRPVLLKRGFGATLKEWVLAAEYIACEGNEAIILCERGIRSFDPELRFTLDLAGAMWARQETRLPVILDPSHAIGRPDLLAGAVAAAAAAGLDGVMLEVHPHPTRARCDADQLLTLEQFDALMARLEPVAAAVGRPLDSRTAVGKR